MNDIINCLFSKTPISPKLRYNESDIIIWPVPCYKIGELELVYGYIGIAFAIPILLTFFLQRHAFLNAIRKVWRNHRSSPAETEASDDELENEEETAVEAPQQIPFDTPTNVLDQVRKLAARKAKRSVFYEKAIDASSAQTVFGQIVMLLAVVCSWISLAVYTKRTFKRPVSLELCGIDVDGWNIVDILANIYLCFYFVLRYLGSHKKLSVIYDLHSFGDYFNIPTVMLTVAIGRRFTGFGYFRIYNLMWLADIATNRSWIRSAVKVRVIRLLILVISIIAMAAGFLHLAESLGDPFLANDDFGHPVYNGQLVPYWRVLLYVYGRITLLDLSGIRLHTHSGRITIFVFQLLAVGIIGKAIPAIIAQMRVKPDYDKPFQKPSSYLHIVVCGCVTSSAMKSFLREFYHRDRIYSEHFKVLILSEKVPDEEMEILIERYFNKLEYKRGSMMNLKDLNRIKLTEAAATLILADRTAADCDADDAANIMRVVAVKNLKGSARVIIQVSQYHNKAYLQNIPSWSTRNGDTIICIAELRLGLLAQSCHAPGFSTLIANLFTTRSVDSHMKYKEPWMVDYTRGAALELYYRSLSRAFCGMTFQQACELCYRKLKIVLLAIQDDPERYPSTPQVNAAPDLLIGEETLGYFLADSKEEASRAKYYCSNCHADVSSPEDIVECDCNKTVAFQEIRMDQTDSSTTHRKKYYYSNSVEESAAVEGLIWSNIQGDNEGDRGMHVEGQHEIDGSAELHCEDSTGMFYWCPEHSLESVIFTRAQTSRRPFVNHIVICILSQKDSRSIGLSNFIYPLRSTSLDTLEEILILCDDKLLLEEWVHLKNMPKIFILKGTALNRADLRAVQLGTCKMCVIIGAPGSSEKADDPTLFDKSVILATLNVRAMKFSDAEIHQAQKTGNTNVPIRRSGHEVPLITDLMRESNAQFLDDDDEDQPGAEFYLTQPFSGGRAFAASTLDLLMITSFFNPEINRVIQSIIFGEASLELEQILAEGTGLIGGKISPVSPKRRGHVRVVQIRVEEVHFTEKTKMRYGDLFLRMLSNMGIVLLGILRKLEGKGEKRVVICSPPDTFELYRSDLAIGLQRTGE